MDTRCENGLSGDGFRHFFLNYNFKSSFWDTYKYVSKEDCRKFCSPTWKLANF